MALTGARSACWLVLAIHAAIPASAFAQVPVKAGKWELTGSFKGLPFGSAAEHSRTACLSEATLGSIPEKALVEASPQPTDDASRTPPKCEYSQVRRDGARSSWALTCEGPTMTGAGSATTTPEQVDITETFELKMAFASRSIQHTVKARRLGDCS